MILPVQFKIKENPYYLRYLRSHSQWYKILNRSPDMFRMFEEEAKREYHLTKSDRIKNVFDTIEVFEKIVNAFK